MELIQITDLHLSDRRDTPAAHALKWAIETCNKLAPDLVAFTGDMTTYGTAAAATHFLDQAQRLQVPWVFTPGNAELRSDGAWPVLADHLKCKSIDRTGVRFLLPDTSSGRLIAADRNRLQRENGSGPHVILTHYPLDTLDEDSQAWFETWLAKRPTELYLAGHRHFSRDRPINGGRETITQGLDPDKAFGGPPGISLFRRDTTGHWAKQAIPWPYGTDRLPAETDHSPVGWSIHGDPIEAVHETYEFGLNAVELRPRSPGYDLEKVLAGLERLRADRPLYLSWHLPNLSWHETGVNGVDAVAEQVAQAKSCGVDALTVHVPQIGAGLMQPGNDAWQNFLNVYVHLFKTTVEAGIRLSIENVHNDPGTALAPQSRKFATRIGEYLAWLDAVDAAIGSGIGRVGAHFDVGHARNNGEMGNYQPLGDWYARIGRRISGYHIHQVRPNEETGRLQNHRDIRSVHDRTVSYAGFLHAWSTGLINRAPLFVEVRNGQERRRTAQLMLQVFS
jgi:sugar phosphate isomerase/epimerase